jgi:Effector-associated domain 7/Domain of unknown function (DUF4062)
MTGRGKGDAARWRLFVSSTWVDLQPERKAVELALHQMQDAEFNGMEYFGSRSDEAKSVCLAEVSRSRVYLGIFAHRYGSIDTESGKSMTELEYRQARSIEIPCLIYLKEEDVTAPVEPALEALQEELKLNHVVSWFRNPDHLATKVVIDLHNLIIDNRLPRAVIEPTPYALCTVIMLHFDLEELKTLCFKLGVDFDSLRGEGKAAKARELVMYLQRRGQLERLIAELKESRPNIAWS